MTLSKSLLTRSLLALVVGVSLGSVGLVIARSAAAQVPENVSPANDEFRTGGCSGCFFTQVEAILANFHKVTRVFRGCGTGSAYPALDGCAGGTGAGGAEEGGHDALLDFIVIQGDLKDSTTDTEHLGVPGGQTNVTYRVSATGSSRGLRCANGGNAAENSLGFLAPEGMDGVPGNSDDAGGTGTFAMPGIPANWPDPTLRTADALVDCTGKTHIQDFANPGLSDPTDFTGMTELCVVQYDDNGNGDIDNKSDGVYPGSYPSIADAQAGNEGTDIRLSCDTGFGDLPPADFESSAFNTQSFSNQQTVGAQIFKIIANNHVAAASDSTKKIMLQLPQVEGAFGGTGLGADACSWKALGGAVDTDPSGAINVCFRENGSGSRETFRNIWMREAAGDKAQGTNVGTFPCDEYLESPGTADTVNKTFVQNNTNADVVNCVEGADGAVGYVNAGRTSSLFYAVPVFGTDPDAPGNDLRTLVKCGMYPYWGPLSGGTGAHASFLLTNPYVAAHMAALRNGAVFSTGEDYLPLGDQQSGVAFDKPLTAAPYNVKFVATDCPGTISPPDPHP